MKFYKENFEEVVERNLKLSDPAYCGAVIHITGIKEIEDRVKLIPEPPLYQWDFDTQLYDYFDMNLENCRRTWSNRTEILDDSLPTVSPHFGIAEHSSFMGGEVDYEEDTSYQVPFVKTEEDIDNLHFQPDNKLLNYVLKGFEYYKEKGGDEIAVELRGCEDAGDVANAIRGNELFMDFYDEPELTHKLFQKCFEGVTQFMKYQHDMVGDFYGGTLSGMSVFMPSNSFGHFAMDWTYMCSSSFFREFGKDLLIRQAEPYQTALMHVHSGGAHIIPELATIDKFSYIQLSEDPNQPTGIETFKKYQSDLKDKFIVCGASFDELKASLDFLQDKRILLQMNVDTFKEAQEIVHFVKENLPIVKRH